MDPLVRRFIDAASEAESERELSTLIEGHALPLAKAIVARKLRPYARQGSDRSPIDDADDVVADAMTTLVQRLKASRTNSDLPAIENFSSYAAAVIHSVCAHQIRRRYPERARLKNRLRYVFSTEQRLALWSTDGEVVCGLSEWNGRPPARAAERMLSEATEASRRPWLELSRAAFTTETIRLVVAMGAPLDFETFVGAIASAAHLVEPRDAGDVSRLTAGEPSYETTIDQRRFLSRVWDEVRGLPLRQRIALLLNLRDANGAGMLWLLPIAGIATIRQIASVLEIPDIEFATLWRDMPLDDVAISARLGCTRQQVINLRMAARKRLMNRMPPGWPAGDRRARGNLKAVSASVKGSA